MVFSTIANGTLGERVRILSTGGMTFNGDTAAANALDDYEEGTWTPVLLGSTTAGTMTGSSEGRYVKIGKMVYLTLRFTNVSFSGSAGTIKISGLPFAQVSTNAYPSAAFGMTYGITFDNTRNQAWYIGGSVIEGIESQSNGSWVGMPSSNFHGSTKYINQVICYEST